jgi:hypothetical protein
MQTLEPDFNATNRYQELLSDNNSASQNTGGILVTEMIYNLIGLIHKLFDKAAYPALPPRTFDCAARDQLGRTYHKHGGNCGHGAGAVLVTEALASVLATLTELFGDGYAEHTKMTRQLLFAHTQTLQGSAGRGAGAVMVAEAIYDLDKHLRVLFGKAKTPVRTGPMYLQLDGTFSEVEPTEPIDAEAVNLRRQLLDEGQPMDAIGPPELRERLKAVEVQLAEKAVTVTVAVADPVVKVTVTQIDKWQKLVEEQKWSD